MSPVPPGAGHAADPEYAVVIPTVGRPSLTATLSALAAAQGPPPRRVVLVDDREPQVCTPLPVDVPEPLADRVTVVPGRAAGPAAARNTGWRTVTEPWVAFLDDDVVPGPTWCADLAADLAAAAPGTGGVQARIHVPLPEDRAPTDWERNTAGLADARWITADMAYRRSVLEATGGFDERFPRAFREDADLALRATYAGWSLRRGARLTTHPVRPADRWVSVRVQAGNADDVLMSRLHGRGWWQAAQAPRGRLPAHVAVVSAAGAAALLLAVGARRPAALCAVLWAGGTAQFAAGRIRPGPRTRQEMATMAVTSVLIPPAAVGHWLRGRLRHRHVRPLPAGGSLSPPRSGAGVPGRDVPGRDGTDSTPWRAVAWLRGRPGPRTVRRLGAGHR